MYLQITFLEKMSIDGIEILAADFDESGNVNFKDGVELMKSLKNKIGSKFVLSDNLGSSDIEIWPGDFLNLVGVVTGDLNGSYGAKL